jgi:CCR4-NOT transcription complex subunit 9
LRRRFVALLIGPGSNPYILDYMAAPAPAPPPAPTAAQLEELTRHVLNLTSSDSKVREDALLELSKKREDFQDLAPMLWHSVGTITALLQEIIAIYPALSPATLTSPASNRVCNALALLQCVASHPETRSLFLAAHIPLYLYPFLNTISRTKPFEYLRLTSLGVIGALVKMDDTEVVNFLLQTEIIPLCLRIMETGTELSKTVCARSDPPVGATDLERTANSFAHFLRRWQHSLSRRSCWTR